MAIEVKAAIGNKPPLRCRTCQKEISDHEAIVFFGVKANEIPEAKIEEYGCPSCNDGSCVFKLVEPIEFIQLETTVTV